MLLADDQNMIQALTPKASDQAFSSAGDHARYLCNSGAQYPVGAVPP